MQYGASMLVAAGGLMAGDWRLVAGFSASVTPARSSSDGSFGALAVSNSVGDDESNDGGSAGTSWPCRVCTTVSSTPGSVGCVRSPVVRMPSSARSS
jgi:hypothetical protein